MRSRVGMTLAASALSSVLLGGCGGNDDGNSAGPSPGGTDAPASAGAGGAGGGGVPAMGAGSRAPTPSNLGISGGPSSSRDGNTADDIMTDDVTPPPMEAVDMLDPNTDWEALTIIFPTMYSAHDGVHLFQVPAYVDGVSVELTDWQAIPASAASFDADPERDSGVLITVHEPAPQITIAASASGLGGTAALFVTAATPEQWEVGEARYNNGVDYELPGLEDIDFSMLLDPNWMPPAPPTDLACNNCHTTGAKYFEFQHTPTQAARFSDEDLRTILTMGRKPAGVGYRILPEMLFGGMTADDVYSMFHRWEASEEEVTGLIVYLRSLTPTGQGDIRLPDGTYVAPGERPPNLPMP